MRKITTLAQGVVDEYSDFSQRADKKQEEMRQHSNEFKSNLQERESILAGWADDDARKEQEILDSDRKADEGIALDKENYAKRRSQGKIFVEALDRALAEDNLNQLIGQMAFMNLKDMTSKMELEVPALMLALKDHEGFYNTRKDTPMGAFVQMAIEKKLGGKSNPIANGDTLCERVNKCLPMSVTQTSFENIIDNINQSGRDDGKEQKGNFGKTRIGEITR